MRGIGSIDIPQDAGDGPFGQDWVWLCRDLNQRYHLLKGKRNRLVLVGSVLLIRNGKTFTERLDVRRGC